MLINKCDWSITFESYWTKFFCITIHFFLIFNIPHLHVYNNNLQVATHTPAFAYSLIFPIIIRTLQKEICQFPSFVIFLGTIIWGKIWLGKTKTNNLVIISTKENLYGHVWMEIFLTKLSLYPTTRQRSSCTNCMSSKSDWSWRTAFTSSWRICCFSSLLTFNSSLKLCCKTHKQVLYIVCFFCRCFHSNTMFFLGNCFSTPKINLSLMNKVTFVSNNVHEHFFAGESVNILKPLI